MSKQLIEKQVKTRILGEARKKVQEPARLDENGAEILDPKPLFIQAGFKPEETMTEKIRRITLQVQAETAAKFAAQNLTDEQIAQILDQEDDFDIPDDFGNILTSYEQRGLVQELLDDVSIEAPPAEQTGPAGAADTPPADNGVSGE